MILVKEWKQHLEELANPENIDVSSFEVQEDLNSDVWDEEKYIKEDIGDRLYDLAKQFFAKLELDWIEIDDIIFTGSLANFTWSEYSDIDLHILIDYTKVDENLDLVKDYLRKSASLWNKNHDIRIKGFEVEMYVQDSNESHYSGGVYSIKNDKWLEVPSHLDPTIDYENIKKKAARLMDDIDEISDLFLINEYEKALKEAIRVRNKIRKFRQSGLEKGGIFSVENLAFKALRRNGYLEKLSSLRILSYDKTMSINGESDEV